MQISNWRKQNVEVWAEEVIQCQNCDLISLDYLMNILHINIFNVLSWIFLQMQMISLMILLFQIKNWSQMERFYILLSKNVQIQIGWLFLEWSNLRIYVSQHLYILWTISACSGSSTITTSTKNCPAVRSLLNHYFYLKCFELCNIAGF